MDRIILKKIHFVLDKVKYFGLRKIYYVCQNFLCFVEEIVNPQLANRFLSRKIINYFSGDSGHNLNPKKTFLGFGLIHYSLIRNIKPKRILCIGSRYGFIPAICALACQENGRGVVDFVDASFEQNHPQSWTGVGFWKKVDPKKHFKFLDLNKWINIYTMTSKEFADKFPSRAYQYIYVDGDHSYEGVKMDYNLFLPRLEKDGFMVFHDVAMKGNDPTTGQPYGVWRFWRELKNKNKITFPFPKESGLGILQK